MSNTYPYVTPRCLVCGKRGKVMINAAGLRAYRNGALLQRAFPDLDADQREQILTGTHPQCWATFVGPEPLV